MNGKPKKYKHRVDNVNKMSRVYIFKLGCHSIGSFLYKKYTHTCPSGFQKLQKLQKLQKQVKV